MSQTKSDNGGVSPNTSRGSGGNSPKGASPDFKKIIVDFTKDILTTFPEYETKLDFHLQTLLNSSESEEQLQISLDIVYEHCKSRYPERFFEILYQNQELFTDTTKFKTTEFLPGIHFSELWNENITDKTRDTLWKYLQLVLFTVVSSISDGASFGDTAKLFEAIDEDEFKAKLGETIAQMQNMFETDKSSNENNENNEDETQNENINIGDLPNPQDIHDHVAGMLDGKLGKLAKEIAEETAADLNMNMDNVGSVNDVFKQLFKNPTKLMSLVKNVGSKLDEKLKSGDIDETELLKEAGEMVKKMKDMPGMGNIQNMMSKMGMNIPSGGKMNMGAMQAHLDRNMKSSQMKDRMRSKLAAKQAQAQAAQQQTQAAQQQAQSQQTPTKLHKVNDSNLVFSTGEKVERSLREDNPEQASSKKKKKNKNKK